MLAVASLAAAVALSPALSAATDRKAGGYAEDSCDAVGGVVHDEVGLLQRGRVGARGIPAEAGDDGSEEPAGRSETLEDIAAALRRNPAWNPLARLFAPASECRMDDDGGCPLRRMRPGAVVDVYPGQGSGAACINSSRPFYFQVRRGATDKLLLYFQGGGACWDHLSYRLKLCTQSPTPQDFSGMLNASDPQNAFRHHTLVHVLFCSGDMHSGNTTQPWGEDGAPVQLRGYNNANSAVQWALEQADTFSEVVFAGCSAGSLGVMMWSELLQKRLRGRTAKFTTFADSFAGVLFPPQLVHAGQGHLCDVWNICGLPLLNQVEQVQCRSKTLLLQEHFRVAMQENRESRFAMVNSKTDAVQVLFQKGYMLTAMKSRAGFKMTGAQYYKGFNLNMQEQVKEDNFGVYLADGTQHCFTQSQVMYTTTPQGEGGGGDGQRLSEWMGELSGAAATSRVVCEGALVQVQEDAPECENTTYCDEAIMERAA